MYVFCLDLFSTLLLEYFRHRSDTSFEIAYEEGASRLQGKQMIGCVIERKKKKQRARGMVLASDDDFLYD